MNGEIQDDVTKHAKKYHLGYLCSKYNWPIFQSSHISLIVIIV